MLNYPLLTDQVEYEVGGLLQEHDQPCWLPVVHGVGPHQADDVEQGRELVGQVQVVALLHLLKHPPQRLQVLAGEGEASQHHAVRGGRREASQHHAAGGRGEASQHHAVKGGGGGRREASQHHAAGGRGEASQHHAAGGSGGRGEASGACWGEASQHHAVRGRGEASQHHAAGGRGGRRGREEGEGRGFSTPCSRGEGREGRGFSTPCSKAR